MFGQDILSFGSAQKRHNTEYSKQIFPEKELRGLSPNSYIYVSVSDLYFTTIGLPILLLENKWTHGGNVEIGTELPQFLFWEYINKKLFAVCAKGCVSGFGVFWRVN